mmetsp:Transcript_10271/g.30900  ORF Transcript_10271/g.30900 Transcript_10271/m.30900 type:complete len:366 (+) Transcript_10271:90-1187(+)
MGDALSTILSAAGASPEGAGPARPAAAPAVAAPALIPPFEGTLDELIAAVDTADVDAIARLAFVPTAPQIDALFEQAKRAEADRTSGRKTRLLSKLPYIQPLCPPSAKPSDTVLSRLAHTQAIVSTGRFALVVDKALVLWQSNGPNTALIDGPDHLINLFSAGTTPAVSALLDEYLTTRSGWLDKIVQSIPYKVAQCRTADGTLASAFPHDVAEAGGIATVPIELWPAFAKVEELFRAAAKVFAAALAQAADEAAVDGACSDPMAILRASVGLGVVSLCQTWMRGNGIGVANAEFSVMSPHFQNRVVVLDGRRLLEATGLSRSYLEAYLEVVRRMDARMEEQNYSGTDGPAFVNLDGLYRALTKK